MSVPRPATEAVDERTRNIDRVNAEARVRLLIEAQRGAADAALAAASEVARAAETVGAALTAGRRTT